MLSGQTKVRVRYAETDQMGVAHHANFMVWFETGRIELLRGLGFDYRQMEELDDCHLPVVEVRCRYTAPARYDEELMIRTQLKNLRGPLLRFAYEVTGASDKALLAEGESTHLVTDSKLQRRKLPEKYLDRLTP